MISEKPRALLRKIHLYFAFSFGLIFVLLGLSGGIIAWMHEIDVWLNPLLLTLPTSSAASAHTGKSLSPTHIQALVNMLSAHPRYGRPHQIQLAQHPELACIASYRLKNSEQSSAFAQQFSTQITRQVMLNPYTLEVLGERRWGELGMTRPLLMSTLYHLHRYLLSGSFGKTVVGFAGLVLILLCISGLMLWWPAMRWSSMRQALTVSFRGSWPRLHYSLHRSSGFWVLPAFIVLGFSGMYFNLPQWVRPVIHHITPLTDTRAISSMPNNLATTAHSEVALSQVIATVQARFPEARLSRIGLPAKASETYELRMRQETEVRQGDGNTRISVDAYSGEIVQIRDPLHANRGDTFLNWMFPLHTGEAFGLTGRIIISLLGLMPLLFMITGTAIWLKRQRKKTSKPRTPRRRNVEGF